LRDGVGNVVDVSQGAAWGGGLWFILFHTTNHIVAGVKFWYRYDSFKFRTRIKILNVKDRAVAFQTNGVPP